MKDMKSLQGKFLQLLEKYCTDDIAMSFWQQLEIHYAETHRHYHNFVHIHSMLQHLEGFQSDSKHEVVQRDDLIFAIFYHDVIYNPIKTDNEYQSALVFKKVAIHINFANTLKVMQMIEDTQAHEYSFDNDTNILIDLDLSILGKRANTYTDYCHNIRKEYQMYSDDTYYAGREKVLHHFLEQQQIFKTQYFYDLYEKTARQNVQTELEYIMSL